MANGPKNYHYKRQRLEEFLTRDFDQSCIYCWDTSQVFYFVHQPPQNLNNCKSSSDHLLRLKRKIENWLSTKWRTYLTFFCQQLQGITRSNNVEAGIIWFYPKSQICNKFDYIKRLLLTVLLLLSYLTPGEFVKNITKYLETDDNAIDEYYFRLHNFFSLDVQNCVRK